MRERKGVRLETYVLWVAGFGTGGTALDTVLGRVE